MEPAITHGSKELGQEAMYLAAVVASGPRPFAEALGLSALFELCESRRAAQVDDRGEFVPLLEQDPRRWDAQRMAMGYTLLQRASRLDAPGPFQIEAAIHGALGSRARTGVVPWPEIATLYRRLIEGYPTTGARVGLAIAVANAEGAERGLGILEALPRDSVATYQPYWVALAHLYEATNASEKAARALQRALGLTTNPRIRRFLEKRRT